jgi:CRP-like cAMP-binding protein
VRRKSPLTTQIAILGATDLFGALSKRQLLQVAELAKPRNFPAGSVIVAEGGTDARFYVILVGRARVTVGGKAHDRLGPGDYFGEIALLDGLPRSAGVRAVTDVETLSIARWNFRPLLKDAGIAEKLLLEMCRRVRLGRAGRRG